MMRNFLPTSEIFSRISATVASGVEKSWMITSAADRYRGRRWWWRSTKAWCPSWARGRPSVSRLAQISSMERSRNTRMPLRRREMTFFRDSTAPPPVAMTKPSWLLSCSSTWLSRERKPRSPSWAKIWEMVRPVVPSISSSQSTKGRPSCWANICPAVVFPQPIIPMRIIFFMLLPPNSTRSCQVPGSLRWFGTAHGAHRRSPGCSGSR